MRIGNWNELKAWLPCLGGWLRMVALGVLLASASTVHAQRLVALSDDGVLRLLEDASCVPEECRWVDIDRNRRTMSVAGTATDLFQIHDSGAIWRFDGQPCDARGCPHWTRIDNNPRSGQIVATRDRLFQIHNSGAIWAWDGEACVDGRCRSWTRLDNNPRSRAIVAGSQALFQLHESGEIWQWLGQPCEDGRCRSWSRLDNNPATRELAAGGDRLFQRHENGSIWRWDGQPCVESGHQPRCLSWTRIDNNSATRAIHAAGQELYQLHQRGNVYRWRGQPCLGESCPHWDLLDNNRATRNLAPGPSRGSEAAGTLRHNLFQAHAGGAVWRWTGNPCTAGRCVGWERITGSGAFTRFSGERQGLFLIGPESTLAEPVFPADLSRDDDIWRLTLEDVQVAGQRERSGDRPYLGIIQFRSDFSRRRSTEVSVSLHEPHDWLSKPALRIGLPEGQDHLFAGPRARLPFWSRDLEWRNLQLVSAPPPGWRPGASSLAELDPRIVNLPVVGAVIIALDNNNTPPHVVRDLVLRIAEQVEQLLNEEIARGNVLSALAPDWREGIQERINELMRNLVSTGETIEMAIQLTVGSTGNPDKLVGLNVLLLPALDAFPGSTRSNRRSGPPLVVDDEFWIESLTAALQPMDTTLRFRGSGGEYLVRAQLDRVVCGEVPPIRRLDLSFLSGHDGLRDNSRLRVHLDVQGRSAPLGLALGPGDGDRRHSFFERSVELPEAIPRSALRAVNVIAESRGGFAQTWDNWTLKAAQVRAGDALLATRSGQPLHRFTRESPELSFDLACAP